MTYYAILARNFLIQAKVAEGDDVVRKLSRIFRYI